MQLSKEFIKEFRDVLIQVADWAKEFNNKKRNYKFDIDDKLYYISKKYEVDLKKEPLALIYNLLDHYCDAVKHSFTEVHHDYSILEAKNDIAEIIENFEISKYETFELSQKLNTKLKEIFNS